MQFRAHFLIRVGGRCSAFLLTLIALSADLVCHHWHHVRRSPSLRCYRSEARIQAVSCGLCPLSGTPPGEAWGRCVSSLHVIGSLATAGSLLDLGAQNLFNRPCDPPPPQRIPKTHLSLSEQDANQHESSECNTSLKIMYQQICHCLQW